jgi:hypothetical protein
VFRTCLPKKRQEIREKWQNMSPRSVTRLKKTGLPTTRRGVVRRRWGSSGVVAVKVLPEVVGVEDKKIIFFVSTDNGSCV